MLTLIPVGKISLPSTTLSFFDLGGQRDIRSIWPRYYDECHAVAFVLDACDQARLSETWQVFGASDLRLLPSFEGCHEIFLMPCLPDEVLNSPRLLNLPLLLLANKQDAPSCLSVAEIRESFDAWYRARPSESEDKDHKQNGEPRSSQDTQKWDDGGAKAERMASLDVMGISALEG